MFGGFREEKRDGRKVKTKPQLFLYFLISLLDHIRNRIVKKNLIGPSMNHWDEHFTIKQTNNILFTSFLATDGPEILQFNPNPYSVPRIPISKFRIGRL